MRKKCFVIYVLILLLTGCSRAKPDYEQTLIPQGTGTPMPTAIPFYLNSNPGYDIIFKFNPNPWELQNRGYWINNPGFMISSGLGFGYPNSPDRYELEKSVAVAIFFSNFRVGTFTLGYLVYSDRPFVYNNQYYLQTCLFHDPCAMVHRHAAGISDTWVEEALCKAILDGQIVVEQTRPVKGHFEFTCRTALDEDVFIKGDFEERQR